MAQKWRIYKIALNIRSNINKKHLFFDRLALLGCTLGMIALFLNWFSLKPNRISAGIDYSLAAGAGLWLTLFLVFCWLACIIFSACNKSLFSLLMGLFANISLIICFLVLRTGSFNLIAEMPDSARVSPGAGLWLTFLACYIVIFASVNRLALSNIKKARYIIMWAFLPILAIFIFSGSLNNISIATEFSVQRSRFFQEFANHLFLVAVSVSIGSITGILLGMFATVNKKIKGFVFFVTNITQTIPSLALFGLLIAPLSALSFKFATLRQIGVSGIGNTPAIIALVIYSLLPVVQNTYTGIKQIDPAVIDAAKGIGMNRFQVFKRIEFPLAAPIVMEGIRIAAVQSVGLAAVAALIGAGGLGWFIFQGLGQAATDMILLGTIPIIALAIFTDFFMRAIIIFVGRRRNLTGGSN